MRIRCDELKSARCYSMVGHEAVLIEAQVPSRRLPSSWPVIPIWPFVLMGVMSLDTTLM
jgi:hypothetical protein